MSQDCLPLLRNNLLPRKTCEVDGFPEAVPTSGEVMTQHRRSEARIDTAEHDTQIRRKDISQSKGDARLDGHFASSFKLDEETGVEYPLSMPRLSTLDLIHKANFSK